MRQIRHYAPILLFLALFAVASWMIYLKLHPKTLPANLIMGVGRMDGDLVRLNAKYPGRVTLQKAAEGLPVHRGELLTRLDSKEQQAKLAQVQAEVAAKKKELAAKRTELSITQKTLPLAVTKARSQLRARQAAVESAQAQVAAQERVVAQDRRDLGRIQNLYQRRLIEKEKLEKARLKLSLDKKCLRGLIVKQETAQVEIRELPTL